MQVQHLSLVGRSSMKPLKRDLVDRMWRLRDEIAELRKERKKLLMFQPFEQEDWDELAIIDARLDELNLEHDQTEQLLRQHQANV